MFVQKTSLEKRQCLKRSSFPELGSSFSTPGTLCAAAAGPLNMELGREDGGNMAVATAVNFLLSWPGVFTFCQPVWGVVGLEGKWGAPDTISEFSISFSNQAAFVIAFDSHKTHCKNKIKMNTGQKSNTSLSFNQKKFLSCPFRNKDIIPYLSCKMFVFSKHVPRRRFQQSCATLEECERCFPLTLKSCGCRAGEAVQHRSHTRDAVWMECTSGRDLPLHTVKTKQGASEEQATCSSLSQALKPFIMVWFSFWRKQWNLIWFP